MKEVMREKPKLVVITDEAAISEVPCGLGYNLTVRQQ